MMNLQGWDFLKENLKSEIVGAPALILQIQLLRDTVVTMFLLIFLNSPLMQLIPMLIGFTYTLYLVLKYKPFNSKALTILTITNEGGYVLTLLVYLAIHLVGDKFTEKKKYFFFGYPLIFLTSLVLVTNLVIGMIETFWVVRNYIRSRKEKK
jgi:hypothetical protein